LRAAERAGTPVAFIRALTDDDYDPETAGGAMALNISRVSVGDLELERALCRALEKVGTPEGEDWTASITTATTGAWHMVLSGPSRNKSLHIEWEIVEEQGHTRYAKAFVGKDEQSVQHVKLCTRKLLWDRIQFCENPIRALNGRVALAFEEAVWKALSAEDMNPVQVRFGLWREGSEVMKVVCKIKYVAPLSGDPHRSWTWWSSLVTNPDELKAELHKALEVRRERHQALQRLFAEAKVKAAARREAMAQAAAGIVPLSMLPPALRRRVVRKPTSPTPSFA
jgi:hypothetical protein